MRVAKKRLDALRTFPKHRLKKWIKAVRELKKHYDKKELKSCPLCSLVITACGRLTEPKDRCLWLIFTKWTCTEYAIKKVSQGVPGIREQTYPKWRAIRLRQLPYWEEALIFVLNEKEGSDG